MNQLEGLHIGKATDIKDPKERRLYRSLEMVQGGLAWGSFLLVILFSWLAPLAILYFLLVFVVFFFALSLYYTTHLFFGFKKMKEHMGMDWIKKLDGLSLEDCAVDVRDWRDVYHVVTFPNYKEPISVIRDSLNALVDSRYPKDKMILILAFEERAGKERQEIAKQIEAEYGGEFFKVLSTFHPEGIVGEIKGKGSNDAWASKQVKELIIDPLEISYDHIIYSSFDIDTQVYPEYFGCVTYHFLTVEKPTRTTFQPVPLYNNNIWDAENFSQTTSLTGSFWQIMCQERPEKLASFSSHSMSFRAIVDVGFKQRNMINEDARIWWQCFFRYDGDYRTQPLYYPVSLDANIGQNAWGTLKQVYKQQKRWGYPEDTAYFLYHALKNKKVGFKKKLALGLEVVGGRWSWSAGSLLIFSLGWLPVIFGQGWFSQSLMSYTIPNLVSRIMTFSMIGLTTSVWVSIILMPPFPKEKGIKKYIFFIFGWFLVPIQMVFLASIPVLEAQTRYMLGKYMGFWVTPKSR